VEKPGVAPAPGRLVGGEDGVGVADVGHDGGEKRAEKGVEFMAVAHEVLVRPGVGVGMAGDADAVEVSGGEGGVQDEVGVLTARGGVEPVHGAVLPPGGGGLGVAGEEVEQGVDPHQGPAGLEDVGGLADVVGVFRGEARVNYADHRVVVGVLTRPGERQGVRRRQPRPGGNQIGKVIMEFYVHCSGVRSLKLAFFGGRPGGRQLSFFTDSISC